MRGDYILIWEQNLDNLNNKTIKLISEILSRKLLFFPVLIACLFFSIACENSTEPEATLNFSEMEIHYKKSGGWIHTSTIDIYGDGLVKAHKIRHASFDTMASATKHLNTKQQNEIAVLFETFSNFARHYSPDEFITDQDYHTIVFIYQGIPDTVSAYMPGPSNSPQDLNRIFDKMQNLWSDMLN